MLNTLILSLPASGIAWAAGIPSGILAAVGRNRWIGRAHPAFVTLALATPRIFLALLALGLAATTGWFPIGGMRAVAGEPVDWISRTGDLLHHLVLPALVLSLSPMAMISGHLRAALSEVVSFDFIRTARAKGLPRRVILGRHALRNILGPLVMLLGYSMGNLLSGSAIIETVMAWPGIGRLTVEAVFARDSDLILATVVLASVLLIVGNLIADMVLLTVNPRVRIRAGRCRGCTTVSDFADEDDNVIRSHEPGPVRPAPNARRAYLVRHACPMALQRDRGTFSRGSPGGIHRPLRSSQPGSHRH